MTTPTAEEIRALMQRHIEYWNEGRLEDWLALWPPTIDLEDPVGTAHRTGGQDLMRKLWDESHAGWRLELLNLIVLGNEAALAVRNTGVVNGTPVTVDSIECYVFDDGALRGRTFFEAPAS